MVVQQTSSRPPCLSFGAPTSDFRLQQAAQVIYNLIDATEDRSAEINLYRSTHDREIEDDAATVSNIFWFFPPIWLV